MSSEKGLEMDAMKKVLALAAASEAATGLALLVVPSLVGQLLLGAELAGIAIPVARVAGIALIGLGIACWPDRQRTESGSSAFLAMLTYSVLIALYLAYLGTVGRLGGLLLWPAVALHTIVALLMVRLRFHSLINILQAIIKG